MCVSNYIICLYDVYTICMPSLLFLSNLNLYLPPFRIFLSRVPKIHLPHYVTYISFLCILPLYLHILHSLAILKLALSFDSFSCFFTFFLKYSGESSLLFLRFSLHTLSILNIISTSLSCYFISPLLCPNFLQASPPNCFYTQPSS